MAKAIMVQGAGSNVGKSMIVAGICRYFANQGLRVAPFKPQNMSNNAAATLEGGEIGRAQALQALAARRAPHTDMNPVLLKPETDTGAQVVVNGQRFATVRARDYGKLKPQLLPEVVAAYHRLAEEVDLVVIEGAGAAAETNLRAGDIANMGFAEAVDAPVILVGDIDRGGVIAQLVGSYHVLDQADRDRIKGFIVNKFRGDITLFEEGAARIAQDTGWANLGTLPWFARAHHLPAEDILDLRGGQGGGMKIAVPRLNRIANFDDLDPLSLTEGVEVAIIEPGAPLPGDADLVLIPGSKSTISDLAAFRANGWDIDLQAHHRRGGKVLGICGGYQMLGQTIADPNGLEGAPGEVAGLGLLDVHTVLDTAKTVGVVQGNDVTSGLPVEGYEIHLGVTQGPDCARPLFDLGHRLDGATSPDGLVRGCYLHGMFSANGWRDAFLAQMALPVDPMDYSAALEQTLDDLAAHLEAYLDMANLAALAQPIRNPVR